MTKREPGPVALFARATLLGGEIALAVLLPTLAGRWMEERFLPPPWGVLGGLAIGFAVAACAVLREARAAGLAEAAGGKDEKEDEEAG